jgi:hypothetical protein
MEAGSRPTCYRSAMRLRSLLSPGLVATWLAACSSTPSSPPPADGGQRRAVDGGPDRALRDANHSPDSGRDADARHDATKPDAANDATTAKDVAPIDAFVFDAGDAFAPLTPWTTQASIFVNGFEAQAQGNEDCRTQICRHNEDTDMIAWNGAIYMVHRTALSQILGPNSGLLIYKSTNDGASFEEVARIDAPTMPIDAEDTSDAADMGRDIRDPAFFIVPDGHGGTTLHLKAITRLPTNLAETQTRDTNVDSVSVGSSSTDGTHWGPLTRLAPNMWSFWRVKQLGGVFYSAAYHDGDSSVSLFSSPDGVTWALGPQVYGVTADTPLETELVEMPNGNMLALVRTDGSDADLPGNDGHQKTRVCWARPPYASFDCPETILGERFDGPVAFFWGERLFVIARRSVDSDGVRNRKRTSLFELSPLAGPAPTDAGADGGLVVVVDAGDAATLASAKWPLASDGDGGPYDDEPTLEVKWWGDLPSAGDTAYAGVAYTDSHTVRVIWYSGDVAADEDWYESLLGPTNIWLGTIDLSLVR